MAIRSFADRTTKVLSEGVCPKGFPEKLLSVTRRKLAMLEAAHALQDLAVPPGNNLHPLHGDRRGQYAISVNDQYRLCFKWHDGNAYAVEFTDYH